MCVCVCEVTRASEEEVMNMCTDFNNQFLIVCKEFLKLYNCLLKAIK